MSLLQSRYVLGNFSFRAFTDLYDLLLYLLHLQINVLFLQLTYLQFREIYSLSLYDLHSFLLISDRLSTRLDNEADINLMLSINFSLYMVGLPFLCSFLTGAEKVIYFSVFSPKQSQLPLNYFTTSSIIKWQSYVGPL